MKKLFASVIIASVCLVAGAQVVSTYYSPYVSLPGTVVPDGTWARSDAGIAVAQSFPIVLKTPFDYCFERRVPKPKEGEPVLPMPLLDPTRPAFEKKGHAFGDAAGIGNASADKQFLAIELFGCAPRIPMTLVEDLRVIAAEEAVRRGRHFVADAQAVLGTNYSGEPVYYGGDRGPLMMTPRLKSLYAKGVRYVLSAIIDEYGTHAYKPGEDPKTPVKYESAFAFHITGYDLDAGEILQTRFFVVHGEGRNYEEADSRALSSARSEIKTFIEANFRRTATITDLGDPNAKDKIKTCKIAVGFADGAVKGDTYQVLTAGENGKTNNIGRVRITDVLGENVSECKISANKDKVVNDFGQGVELVLLTD